MDPNQQLVDAIKAVEALIYEWIDEGNVETRDSFSTPENPSPFFMIATLGGLSLHGENARKYLMTLETLANAAVGVRQIDRSAPPPTRAKGTVESSFQIALMKGISVSENPAISNEARIRFVLDELKASLTVPEKPWIVRMPVFGMIFTGQSITVSDVVFLSGSDELVDSLMDSWSTVQIERVGLPSAEFSQRTEADLAPYFSSGIVAEVCVQATDGESAVAIARQKIGFSLNIWNFLSSAFIAQCYRAYLPGETVNARTMVVAETVPCDHLIYETRLGPCPPLLFDGMPNFAVWKETLDKITSLSPSNLPNSAVNRLLYALNWAGRAVIEEQEEQAFSLYTVALETLLIRSDDKFKKTQKFGTRCAALLGNDEAARNGIHNTALHLYEVRSKIVHIGLPFVPAHDLGTVRSYAISAILVVLDATEIHDATEQEMDEWIRSRWYKTV
jgi:hypothetical protein